MGCNTPSFDDGKRNDFTLETMLQITPHIFLPEQEVEITAIRAQGSGGQNVNKVASAIHLRFDIRSSSLPPHIKEKLLQQSDSRLTSDGCFIIKAQQFRTQEQNREDGFRRLVEIIRKVTIEPKKRKATRPSRAAKAKRLESKTRRGKIKAMRKKID